MKIQWRPYQLECFQAINDRYKKGVKKQLIVAATGTGKRMMAVNLMKHFDRSLFIAHREELINQAYDEIEQYWPDKTGIIKGPRFEIDKQIVVASIQTLHNRLKRIDPDTFDLVIIDEAHHYISPTYLKSVRHFNPILTTCWTATPKRLDGLSLSNIAEEIVFQYKIEDGIRDGWLAPLEAYQVKTGEDISRVKRTAGDFNQKQLSEKIDSELRNDLIVKKYMEYAEGRQAIAYCVDINHAYNLRDMFRNYDISCETVVSDTSRCPNRTELVEKFSKGKINILANVGILTEGYDYKDIGCIIMARPTQSETLYIQSIGRGTRLKSNRYKKKTGSDNCIILDFVDNTGKLALINAYELEKKKPLKEKIFIPEMYRKDDLFVEEREKHERMIKVLYGTDKKIDLLELPEIRFWNSAKMLESATEKQIKWIRDMGVYQRDVEYTKAMANELISAQPAREWQIRWLADRNYNVINGVTLGQFQQAKYEYERNAKYV